MSSTLSWVNIILLANSFILSFLVVNCNVINLDQENFEELTRNSNASTKFIYGFQVPNGDNMRYVKKFLEFETRLKSRLQRFDVDVDVFAINCLNDKVGQICADNKNEFHVLHGYHNDQTFTQRLNPRERISERFIIKQALKFVDPGHIDGCEDIILNSIHYEDPLVQDDEVEVKWYQNRKADTCFSCPLNYKNLKQLCKKSMNIFLTNNTFSLVLFHANVDTASRSLLEQFIHASTLRSDQVMGAVSCTDWPDVCEKYDIHSWPQIWFFKNDQKYHQYMMPYEPTLMAKSLDLINLQPVTLLTSHSQLEAFSRGETNSSSSPFRAVTVGFFSSISSAEYEKFKQVADDLHGHYIIGAIFEKTAQSWLKQHKPELSLPTVISFIPADNIQTVYPSDIFQTEDLRQFIKLSSTPLLVELNVKSFPTLAFHKELLVITILPDGRENFFFENLRELAKTGRSLKTKFVFIDKSKEPILACKVIKSYHLKLSRSNPTIIGLKNGNVFVYDRTDELAFDIETVSNWTTDINMNRIRPKITLKALEVSHRPIVFDYLDLIYSSKTPESSLKMSKVQMDENTETIKHDEHKRNKSSIKHEEL